MFRYYKIKENNEKKSTTLIRTYISFSFLQIAPYKIPQYVTFLHEFPRTVSGKVQKYKLKKMAEEILLKN